MKTTLVALAAAACLLPGALGAATTFAELQAEISAAEDGATVLVENDIEYTSRIFDAPGKSITLASPEGQTNTLTRAASYTSGECMVLAGDDDVTLRNVVIDGNKAAGLQSVRFIDVTGGTLTLDAGCELRNVWQSNEGSIRVIQIGSLVMNDGAVIRAFKNAKWGTAVMIGDDAYRNGSFTMNGGLITECESTCSDDKKPGEYGGAVYCYGGKFCMYGGSVTGNTGANCCAGVAGYLGEIHLKGDASVTNNIGEVVNDICYWGNDGGAYIYFDGPWTGYATVYAPRVTGGEGSNNGSWACYVNGHSGFSPGNDFMPGLGKLSVQGHPEYVANGYTRNVDKYWLSVYFVRAKARIGDRLATATWEEALASVQDGESINLLQDLELPSTVNFTNGPMRLTIQSSAESPVTIWRNPSRCNQNMFMVSNHVDVTFKNVIIDGKGDDCESEQRTLIVLRAEGHVTLGDGAILQNCTRKGEAAAVYAVESGTTFTMEEGSVVRNFRTTGVESWATAIRIGGNNSVATAPVFTMNGGVISNCVSDTEWSVTQGYGGAVYVHNGYFYMNGGTITGNSALGGGCAGVQTWGAARVYFSGNATVTNNSGLHPDVYRNGAAFFYMRGDFRGSVGLSHTTAADAQLGIKAEEGATGAWNFFSAKTEPYGKYVGYMWNNNRQIYFREPDGWVDGRGVVCQYENFAHFTPTAIDADVEALPHTFGGAAKRAGGNVVVTFDEAAAREAGRTVIPLVAADEGDVLTGEWTFEVPVAEKGCWIVDRIRSAAGVVAYQARWSPPGMSIVIR